MLGLYEDPVLIQQNARMVIWNSTTLNGLW